MKHFSIVGDNHEKTKQLFIDKGCTFDEKNPEFVVSYGGDGTLLRAEFLYPSIPKLLLRIQK